MAYALGVVFDYYLETFAKHPKCHSKRFFASLRMTHSGRRLFQRSYLVLRDSLFERVGVINLRALVSFLL